MFSDFEPLTLPIRTVDCLQFSKKFALLEKDVLALPSPYMTYWWWLLTTSLYRSQDYVKCQNVSVMKRLCEKIIDDSKKLLSSKNKPFPRNGKAFIELDYLSS